MKLQLLLIALCLAFYAAAEEFLCENDVLYRENSCNRCGCSKGELVCHLRSCPGVKVPPCEVGSKYTRDCNTCWCTKDIGTICTDHEC